MSLRHVERPRYHRIHRRKYDNEALLALDTLVAAAVEDVPANDPPQSPALGDCYLVGNTPSGEWSQFPGHIAAFGGGGWTFIAPREGMAVLVKASGLIAAYRAGTW